MGGKADGGGGGGGGGGAWGVLEGRDGELYISVVALSWIDLFKAVLFHCPQRGTLPWIGTSGNWAGEGGGRGDGVGVGGGGGGALVGGCGFRNDGPFC